MGHPQARAQTEEYEVSYYLVMNYIETNKIIFSHKIDQVEQSLNILKLRKNLIRCNFVSDT